MLDTLISFDRQLLLQLNGSDSLYWDRVMMTVTHTSTWIFIIVALIVVMMRNFSRSRILLAVLGIALTVLIADQFSSSFCKPFFHRLRPSHDPLLAGALDIVDGYRSGLYGFISSHAANTFGVATFVALLMRSHHLTFVLFFWASLSSYSRIYLGVHYPGDILCGAAFGIITGWSVYQVFGYFVRRTEKRRSYYSSRYNSSGVLVGDIYWLESAFFITYIFVLLKACF